MKTGEFLEFCWQKLHIDPLDPKFKEKHAAQEQDRSERRAEGFYHEEDNLVLFADSARQVVEITARELHVSVAELGGFADTPLPLHADSVAWSLKSLVARAS